MPDPTIMAPADLPGGFLAWMPATQALVLAALTYIQEDLPTLGAAVLSAGGQLGFLPAFAGCFLGIWTGDALLYLAGRVAGRSLRRRAWVSRWVDGGRLGQAGDWLAARGAWMLVISRWVPGTRLPTYLAAGLVRMPATRFLVVTGITVLVWTALLFGLAWLWGPGFIARARTWLSAGTASALAVALCLGLIRGAAALASAPRRRRVVTWIVRWTRWEFWPAWLFYLPVLVQYARLAWRHRGLALPSAANPGIFAGGLVGESKIETLQDLSRTSPVFTAEALRIDPGCLEERWRRFDEWVTGGGRGYPVVVKPDLGQRGAGVRIAHDPAQARRILEAAPYAVVVQRFAPGPFEAGVFYVRRPGEARGRIFSITDKVFPCVVGDGVRTVEALIWADDRARFVASRYASRLGARLQSIPAPGERVRLVEAGNHAQGCLFRDGRHLWTPELEARIDEISRRLDGFHVGRFDIRYASVEEFCGGTAFQIVELNGAAAEATHIYDARNTLRSAYATLFRQWELVFEVAAANRSQGHAPMSVVSLLRAWRNAAILMARYPVAD